MKVISIVNPKGGAGKTVTAVNLAYAMSLKGKKVLLIDVEERTKVFADALKEFTEFFNSNDLELNSNILSKNYVRKDSNINNAMLENLDIINYKKFSPSSTDYRNIANELIKELE